jgi:hypothetical protein
MKPRHALQFWLLVGLGCSQIVADVVGMPRVKAVAAATQIAPAMKVFTAHQGYETHAARFALHWRNADGSSGMLPLTPENYATVEGPYNRRNVYGAALAYGPILRADERTRPLHDSVTRYAFCEPGVMRHELGIPLDAQALAVRITPRTVQRPDLETSWEIQCD